MTGTDLNQVDPGKTRALQRVTTEDGFFLTCALDHGDDYRELIDPDLTKVSYEATVDSKLDLIAALAPEVSSFLLDPEYAAGQAILSRALPSNVGLMICVEAEGGYEGTEAGGETRFRPGWDAAKVKRIGADVCKLLWFFRPDSPVQGHQCQVVRKLAAECAELSLPLVVEPIWPALDGEDPMDDAWRARRHDGIVESAAIACDLGADMLKMEFPGDVTTPDGKAAAAAACARLDDGIDVPWVILSAGVDFDDFKTQVEIACKAGASGFVAGRSIWRDAVPGGPSSPGDSGIERARIRLAELAEITRASGRPCLLAVKRENLARTMPAYWYRSWH